MAKNMLRLPNKKHLFHFLGVGGLVGALVFYKYIATIAGDYPTLFTFATINTWDTLRNLIVPLGMSYFVFRQISYLTDILWNVGQPASFLEYLLYNAYFPSFTAGPITRFERRDFTNDNYSFSDFQYGFQRSVFGLVKVITVTGLLGQAYKPVWDHPAQFSILSRVLSLTAYTLFIYIQFSGYCDIVIGIARGFGHRMMENFNFPYFSVNISQFWQRWHISLSSWIRDYLFFPLNSISSARFWQICCVPIIAMGLCGMWHGSTWSFLLWGIWHGLGIFIFQIWQQYKRKHKAFARRLNTPVFIGIAILLTDIFVGFGWLIFGTVGISSITNWFDTSGSHSLPHKHMLLIIAVLIGVMVSRRVDQLWNSPVIQTIWNRIGWIVTILVIECLLVFPVSHGELMYAGF
jgi:alginate O-acetyltransferase complex protein AlgI